MADINLNGRKGNMQALITLYEAHKRLKHRITIIQKLEIMMSRFNSQKISKISFHSLISIVNIINELNKILFGLVTTIASVKIFIIGSFSNLGERNLSARKISRC